MWAGFPVSCVEGYFRGLVVAGKETGLKSREKAQTEEHLW